MKLLLAVRGAFSVRAISLLSNHPLDHLPATLDAVHWLHSTDELEVGLRPAHQSRPIK